MTEQQTFSGGLAKCTAAARLASPARRAHRAILAGYARTGRPPSHAELRNLADADGADLAGTLGELLNADLIVIAPDAGVRAAYPFSTAPTPHSVAITDGPTVYAMCAIDALGISAMLDHPVTITSHELDTGRTVVVHVDGEQATWTPSGAVVFAGASGDCCAPSVDRTCGHINFFTTPDAAHRWAARHPEIAGTVLDQCHALTYGIAEFGTLLHEP